MALPVRTRLRVYAFTLAWLSVFCWNFVALNGHVPQVAGGDGFSQPGDEEGEVDGGFNPSGGGGGFGAGGVGVGGGGGSGGVGGGGGGGSGGTGGGGGGGVGRTGGGGGGGAGGVGGWFYPPEGGEEEGGEGETGTPQIIEKALVCFNDKNIYKSCEESYRLDENGDLHVPPDHTDIFCNGPCLTETDLVLKCIEGVVSNFHFYNHATIKDIKDTIHAGCGNGSQRGNFNVTAHIQANEGDAPKNAKQAIFAILMVAMGWLLLL